jgi:chitinase
MAFGLAVLAGPAALGASALVTGYWENFTNGATTLKLRNVPLGYNLVAVAFGEATSTPGAVTFDPDPAVGYSGTAEFIADIAVLHGQGRKVILSVGGASGTLAVADSSAASAFASSFVALMNQYGFDGVDIDLEHGITPTALAQALRSIAAAKPGVIITMAPQTLDMQSTSASYFELALSIKDILTVVNLQFYNSGTMRGCDGKVYTEGSEDFLTALACIELENGLRPDQVGLGTPASTAASGSGYVAPSLIVAAIQCLETGAHCGGFHPPTTWPGIGGAMVWSINWDASNGYDWIDTIAPALTTGPCTASVSTLCIDDQPGDGRFAITVAFTSPTQAGKGAAIPLKSLGVTQGGLFWFFDSTNPEMLVKVIDGCGFNGSFWLFYAAATNVGMSVQAVDTKTGATRSYSNPDGRAAAPVQDTSAFACTGGDLERGHAAAAERQVAEEPSPLPLSRGVEAPSGPSADGCVASRTNLCIDDQAGDHRFSVSVTFQAPSQTGNGTAIALSPLGVSQGGLFWFFDATNPEMLVKIIDACSLNGFFWFFESAGTNVGFKVVVTDTLRGLSKSYSNTLNHAAAPVQDTSALPCPK